MILGKRPISFFGPDRQLPENLEDWHYERRLIVGRQLEWDEKFLALPWYKRVWSRLLGEETEPVNTSEGMPIDTLVNECIKQIARRNENN